MIALFSASVATKLLPHGVPSNFWLLRAPGIAYADEDALVLPRGAFGGSTVVLWSTVARSDIAWNFEKFLVDGEGNFVKRYSRYYDTNKIADDIDALL